MENSINGISQYNNSRITTARQHINQTLSLQGQRLVNLDAYPTESGNIKVNTIEPNLPWNGIYHGGCPIELKGNAKQGLHFFTLVLYCCSILKSKNRFYSSKPSIKYEFRCSL